MKTILFFVIILFNSLAFSNSIEECKWCLNEDLKVKSELIKFLDLTPKEQLAKIESMGIPVFILNSKRKNYSHFFQWKQIREDQGELNDISKIEGSLGKTLCQNERPIAKAPFTIILSSDAPVSTLAHEYLHVLQIKRDPTWCKTSSLLWNSKPNEIQNKLVRNHEWDVRLILWENINNKAFNIEDQIVIAEGMINEATLRKSFDQKAFELIKEKNIISFLESKIREYK